MRERTEETLIVSTDCPDLRSEIWGWTHEDSNMYVPDKMIGYSPSPSPHISAGTVLEAQFNGWKLLGPPCRVVSDDAVWYEWWLVR